MSFLIQLKILIFSQDNQNIILHYSLKSIIAELQNLFGQIDQKMIQKTKLSNGLRTAK